MKFHIKAAPIATFLSMAIALAGYELTSALIGPVRTELGVVADLGLLLLLVAIGTVTLKRLRSVTSWWICLTANALAFLVLNRVATSIYPADNLRNGYLLFATITLTYWVFQLLALLALEKLVKQAKSDPSRTTVPSPK